MTKVATKPLEIWTIGHSTHTLEFFLEELAAFHIETLIDVRRFAASRRYPHFNATKLGASLADAGVQYHWLPALGGRRPVQAGSRNDGWRNQSFRGYADYMETPDFEAGIHALLEIARTRRTAIMCAEAVWWRCHRALISDTLKARGIEVTHIFAPNKSEQHPYTSVARIVDGRLTYEANKSGKPSQPALSLDV